MSDGASPPAEASGLKRRWPLNAFRKVHFSPRLYLFAGIVCLYVLSISTSAASRNIGEGFLRIAVLERYIDEGGIYLDHGDSGYGLKGRLGGTYLWHEFGQNIFALPFHYFFRGTAISFFIVNILATAMTAMVVFNFLSLTGFDGRASFLTSVTYATGTLAWNYAAKAPFEHPVSVLFMMASIYYAVRYQKGLGAGNLVLCALCIGIGFTVRYDAILASVPVTAYLYLGRDKNSSKKLGLASSLLLGGLILLPFIVSHGYYNYVRFGDYFDTGRGRLVGEGTRYFALEYIPMGVLGALFSPGKSIFLFSPAIAVSLLFAPSFRRRTDGGTFLLLSFTVGIYCLFYISHFGWDGEMCFGPRYFLPVIPIMVMPLAVFFYSWKRVPLLKKYVVVLILVLSVVLQFVFVASNTGLSNIVKYGPSDDILRQIEHIYARDYGRQGTWTWLWSFFNLDRSQFLIQLKLFYYTFMMNQGLIDKEGLYSRFIGGDHPFMVYYIGEMLTLDFWWLQYASVKNYLISSLLCLLCYVSLRRAWMLVAERPRP